MESATMTSGYPYYQKATKPHPVSIEDSFPAMLVVFAYFNNPQQWDTLLAKEIKMLQSHTLNSKDFAVAVMNHGSTKERERLKDLV